MGLAGEGWDDREAQKIKRDKGNCFLLRIDHRTAVCLGPITSECQIRRARKA
jgi:hypothetical protein